MDLVNLALGSTPTGQIIQSRITVTDVNISLMIRINSEKIQKHNPGTCLDMVLSGSLTLSDQKI